MGLKLVKTGSKDVTIETIQKGTGRKIKTEFKEIQTTYEPTRHKCRNKDCKNTARSHSAYCKACSQKYHAEKFHQEKVQQRIAAASQ